MGAIWIMGQTLSPPAAQGKGENDRLTRSGPAGCHRILLP